MGVQSGKQEEIRHAMFVFDRGGFTVLNVTNKPIESTANEILNLMSERFSYRGKKIESPYRNESEEDGKAHPKF